jgi:hypothetical protein
MKLLKLLPLKNMAKRITGDPETDRLMQEAEELRTGKKSVEKAASPGATVTTFLDYQRRATMHNGYQIMTVPALGLQAAVGRLAVATMRQGSDNPVKEENIASDLAYVLYYLSSMCDQNAFTLQKIAEISLDQLEKHTLKKIGK